MWKKKFQKPFTRKKKSFVNVCMHDGVERDLSQCLWGKQWDIVSHWRNKHISCYNKPLICSVITAGMDRNLCCFNKKHKNYN